MHLLTYLTHTSMVIANCARTAMRSSLRIITPAALIVLLSLLAACEAEEPTREDSPEMITTVVVTFTPVGGGVAITGKAVDPDGDGIRNIESDGPLKLKAGATYQLTLLMYNDLAAHDSDQYEISAEVKNEADEHMLFFGWTNNLFSNPSGNGNIDSRDDAVLYEDEDDHGLPLGLVTQWTTATPSTGVLRILLKHQPDLKSETSTADIGESDLDVVFDIEVN
jgi:hypothetical protein